MGELLCEVTDQESPRSSLGKPAVNKWTKHWKKLMHAAAGTAAIVGTPAVAPERAEAGFVIEGTLQPAEQVNEQAQYAVSLTNQEVFYDMLNADGSANAMMRWIGVETGNDPYKVNYPTDFGSDGNPTALIPNPPSVPKEFFLIEGDLAEFQKYRYLFNVESGPNAGNMNDFLKNATVYVGFGQLNGSPTSLQEAVAMSEGIIMKGNYPGVVDVDQEWILSTNVAQTPEPDSALIAIGIGGGMYLFRRKMGNALKK